MPVAVRQVNALAWLEGVCGDADAAAALLNSALGPLLVRLLAAAPAPGLRARLASALGPGLRARLASALGLLVRHTAFIGPELAACGDAQHGPVHVDMERAAGTCGRLRASVEYLHPFCTQHLYRQREMLDLLHLHVKA